MIQIFACIKYYRYFEYMHAKMRIIKLSILNVLINIVLNVRILRSSHCFHVLVLFEVTKTIIIQ